MKTGIKRDAWVALGLGIAAAVIYWVSASLLGRVNSPGEAYFDRLAVSFLRGRLSLSTPSVTHDLTLFNGQWYVPFPPLPALLLLPWVAWRGVEKTNTVVFAVLMGAVNVALVFLFLQTLARRGWTRLSPRDDLWLTVLFGVGSVHWYMATVGSVWFVAQICAVTCMLLAAWLAATTGLPLLTGVALGMAMLARPHVVLVYPLLLALGMLHLRTHGEAVRRPALLRWVGVSGVPIAAAALLLLGYNQLRFGDVSDFGYKNANVARELRDDLQNYGQFNLRYVPHNLWAMLLAGPVWDSNNHRIVPVRDGMSLLLVTPALILIFRARQRSPLTAGAWLALGLLLVPLLLYYNTGWWQFGYRFSLDFMLPVVTLLALGADQGVARPMQLLILLGVLVNAWGVWWFLNPKFF